MTSTDTKKIFHKIKCPLIMIKRLCKLGRHFSIWQTAPVQNPQQHHPEGVRGTVALRSAKHIHIDNWSMKNPAKFAKSLHVPHYQPYQSQVLVTVRRVFYVSTAWAYAEKPEGDMEMSFFSTLIFLRQQGLLLNLDSWLNGDQRAWDSPTHISTQC